MNSGIVTHLVPTSIGGVLLALLSLSFAYQLWQYAYNIFFHPLRKFPGPITAAASRHPLISHALRGEKEFWITALHAKYGDIVRISPNELNFASASAGKDIYGHKRAGQPTLEKDPVQYSRPDGEVDIINAGDAGHTRMRRVFSHAFSDRALKLQQGLFSGYVDKLIEKLQAGISKNAEQQFDIVRMLNFTTFDIMGDLTFGEPLDMLANDDYHPWVAGVIGSFRFGVYLHSMQYFPAVEKLLLKYCVPQSLRDRMQVHKEFSIQRVNRRLEKKVARADIWGLVLERDETTGLSKEEMYSSSALFMIAGTETTATTLSGLIYYLLTNPDKLDRLVSEVRTTFKKTNDITIERLQALPYLLACLEEGLRMFPPVPFGLPRKTPAGAPTDIDGYEVPPQTRVLYTHLAAYRYHGNWHNPYQFVPERWLNDVDEGSLYVTDKKDAFIPFSAGPGGCLGKNMVGENSSIVHHWLTVSRAYHEMRLILTKILWHFDLQLCPESEGSVKQKIFLMWDKPPLYCRLKPVRQA